MNITIELHRDLPASADRTWYWVGKRFGDVAIWSSALSDSCMVGGDAEPVTPAAGEVRTCVAAASWPIPAGTVREELVTFDDASKSFSYRAIEGLPGFIKEGSNAWSVTALSPDKSRVAMKASIGLGLMGAIVAPLMRLMLRRMGKRVLADLETHILTTPERLN